MRRMEPAGEMREKVFDLTAKCCEPLPTLPSSSSSSSSLPLTRMFLKGRGLRGWAGEWREVEERKGG